MLEDGFPTLQSSNFYWQLTSDNYFERTINYWNRYGRWENSFDNGFGSLLAEVLSYQKLGDDEANSVRDWG